MAAADHSLRQLYEVIDTCPIIDNHAHPLLKPEYLGKYPLASITSEAHGDAIADASKALPSLRATRQLASLLGCHDLWDAVEASIQQIRADAPEQWTRTCLGGIETLLIDDGLDGLEQVHGYSWHDMFTRSRCKRIVRIEAVAGDIISRHCAEFAEDPSKTPAAHFAEVGSEFREVIGKSLADPDVVSFKSIICYRSGLDIVPKKNLSVDDAEADLRSILQGHASGQQPFKKLRHVCLNQLLVQLTADMIEEDPASHKKPIQFHTGLGDNDITLTRSSPSHLQEFIREHPKVPIILLHGGYPWTREMSYLATHYANVYADIGEVFPFLSRHGQEGVVSQVLELCPWSKILWSTDGHWFPETYVLATVQVRSVFKSVMGNLVQAGDLSEPEAIQVVQDMFFNNSNRVYDLRLDGPIPISAPIVHETGWPRPGHSPVSTSTGPLLQRLRSTGAKWLRIYWNDYTGSARCRAIPMAEVYRRLESGKPFSITITKASLGLLQMDMPIPEIDGSGMYTLTADWSSMKAGPVDNHISCYGDLTEMDGSEEPLCPRALLRNAIDRAAQNGLSFLMGFEIEFVVMERNPDVHAQDKYQILRNDGHAWAMARALADWGREGSFVTAMDDILDALDAAGIHIEAFHPESAPGQYEIVLPPLPPLAACDTLLHARQILESVATRHGFRLTLHPKPFAMACGTASHVHMSISSSGGNNPAIYEAFYAGIMKHFGAIIAFTYSNPTSYERMVDSFWAGGRWITWGTQNKEAPLRKCEDSHWELKVMDGLASPYFAVAAIIAAGVDGVAAKVPFTWRDCLADPAKLTPEEREKLGISQMFPADLGEALKALQDDKKMVESLHPKFVKRYIQVKKAELAFLEPMSPEERRRWVLERY